MNEVLIKRKPNWVTVLSRKCPLCSVTKLQKPGKWFSFREGCPNCQYLYEREEGYFLGAAWMINYPVIGVSLMAIGAVLFLLLPDYQPITYAAILSFVAVFAGLFFFPFGRALWMCFDLQMHPLTEKDHKRYKERKGE